MTKYLLSLAVVFLLATTGTNAQTTTFNYLSAGFSTSSCNLFSPAVNVTGSDGIPYLHTSVYGAPLYSGGVSLHDWHSTAQGTTGNGNFGTAYAVSYLFKPGFTYTITVTVASAWAQGEAIPNGPGLGTNTPGATNNFVLSIGNTLPGTSNYVGCPLSSMDPPTTSPFTSPIYSTGLPTSTSPSTVTVSNVLVLSNSQYLLIGSWPGAFVNGANYTTGEVNISGITITATPQILPSVSYVCSSQVYSIDGSQPATWTVSPATGVVSIAPNGNSVTVTKTGAGNAVLTATIPGGISYSQNIATSPSCNISTSSNGTCSGSYQTWYVDAVPNCPNANNWSWTVDNPSSTSRFYIDNSNAPATFVDVSGGGGISVSFDDACGVKSAKNGVTLFSECNTGAVEGAAFSVFPNPASGSTTITALTPADTATTAAVYAVRIMDKTGNIRKTQQFAAGMRSAQVSLVGLSPDVYFISIFDGKKWTTQHIVIR